MHTWSWTLWFEIGTAVVAAQVAIAAVKQLL